MESSCRRVQVVNWFPLLLLSSFPLVVSFSARSTPHHCLSFRKHSYNLSPTSFRPSSESTSHTPLVSCFHLLPLFSQSLIRPSCIRSCQSCPLCPATRVLLGRLRPQAPRPEGGEVTVSSFAGRTTLIRFDSITQSKSRRRLKRSTKTTNPISDYAATRSRKTMKAFANRT
jgi:hypothetical protein